MITATCWVPRGAAAENPVKTDLDEEEIARISALSKMELQEAEEELQEAKGTQANPPVANGVPNSTDDDLKEYNMDDYDKEIEEDNENTIAGVNGLSYYAPDEQDDYLTLPSAQDDEEEQEELRVLKTDNMVLAAKTEDDLSVLEVHVYDDQESSLYVHHDILLPSFPLCLEWLPITPGTEAQAGNYVAVGTFDPEIELWNLDTIDAMYPAAILGKSDRPEAQARGTGKKKKKMKMPNDSYHVDAILALASNPNHSNLLASGSADCTIKLWDLQSGSSEKAVQSFRDYHKDKISSLAWNLTDPTVLLSGGYDKVARVGDMRSANIKKDSRGFSVSSDIEGTQWDKDGVHFYVGSDNGRVYKFDARSTSSKPLWMLQAHDADITGFSVNKHIDNLLVTSSGDHTVKLWNLNDDKPSMVLSRDFDVGKVFSVGWGPESESKSLLSVAGSEGNLKVWDAFSNRVVRGAFGGPQQKEFTGERLAVANDDNDEDESDDGGADIGEEDMDEE